MSHRLSYNIILICTGALLWAGCASTQKRFEKAQDLEGEGRYAEAADYYIKVLEKESDWKGARARLQDAGDRAIEDYLDEAEATQADGRYEEALHILDRLDKLRADARAVGVALAVPGDYTSYRENLRARAVEDLRRQGALAEQSGNWEQAVGAYERARQYTTDRVLLDELSFAQGRVHLRWAEAEADRGHYRAAFAQAQQVVEVFGPDDPLSRRALDLQQEALDAGTRLVAFLPFWRTDGVGRDAPEALMRDLNDVLFYEYWSAPVPFVAAADPVGVRRELRRLRYDRTVITRTQAVEIGRVVDADFVVVGEVTGFERRERNLKEKIRKARFKGRASTVGGSKDTTYVEQRLTLEFRVDVAYRIIDTHTRDVVDQGSMDARESQSLTRAVFAGDYTDLDLSGSERSLFEDEERLVSETLAEKLADDLAARLAERMYSRLVAQIR